MAPHVALLLGTLHWISPSSRRVIVLLGAYCKLSADLLARTIGMRNRYQLARVLALDGLPPLQELRTWVRLISWMLEWDRARISLYQSATRQDLEPATCYRAIKKATGVTWKEVRAGGVAGALLKLREKCRAPADVERTASQKTRGAVPSDPRQRQA